MIKETMESLASMEVMDFLVVREKEVPRVKRVLKVRQDGRGLWVLEDPMDLLVRRESGELMEFSLDKMQLILEGKEKKDLRGFLVQEDPRVTGEKVECRVCQDCQELKGFQA